MAIAVWCFNTPQGIYKDTKDLKARFFEDRHAGAWRRDKPKDFTYIDTKTHTTSPGRRSPLAIKALMD